MNPNDCPRHCDCSHPSECIFNQPQAEAERPSYAVVWIVGAVVVVAVLAILLVVFL
jgi:hypothetical protein